MFTRMLVSTTENYKNPSALPKHYSYVSKKEPFLPPKEKEKYREIPLEKEDIKGINQRNFDVANHLWQKASKDALIAAKRKRHLDDEISEGHTCMWCGGDFQSSDERDAHEDKCADE